MTIQLTKRQQELVLASVEYLLYDHLNHPHQEFELKQLAEYLKNEFNKNDFSELNKSEK